MALPTAEHFLHTGSLAYHSKPMYPKADNPLFNRSAPPKPERKTMDTMNYSKAVFLTDMTVRAVMVKYHEDGYGQMMFKTRDARFKVDDLAVVPTQGSNDRVPFTVGRITAVDVEPDIEDSQEISWIVGGPVNISAHKELIKEERELIDKIKQHQRAKKRQELLAAAGIAGDEDFAALPLVRGTADQED